MKSRINEALDKLEDFIEEEEVIEEKQLKWAECTYCGDFATELDHVIPHSWETNHPNHKRKNQKLNFDIKKSKVVPCCSECNNLLTNYAVFTISERADHISNRLAEKHRKLLGSAFWSEFELTEISYNLKTSIKHRKTKKERIIERIRFANYIKRLESLTIANVWSCYHKGVSLTEILDLV